MLIIYEYDGDELHCIFGLEVFAACHFYWIQIELMDNYSLAAILPETENQELFIYVYDGHGACDIYDLQVLYFKNMTHEPFHLLFFKAHPHINPSPISLTIPIRK